jgi:hypothetical protein
MPALFKHRTKIKQISPRRLRQARQKDLAITGQIKKLGIWVIFE